MKHGRSEVSCSRVSGKSGFGGSFTNPGKACGCYGYDSNRRHYFGKQGFLTHSVTRLNSVASELR